MRKVFIYTSKDGAQTFKVRYKIDGRSGSTTFPTESEADQFNLMIEKWGARRALEFIKQPTEPKRIGSGPTVSDCVADYIALQPNPGTRGAYESWLRSSIKPGLGSVRINELQSRDVQLWVNAQPGSSGTISRNHVLLSAALRAAVGRGQIGSNPASGVKIPRRARNEARAPLNPPYTRREYELIREAMSLRYQPLVAFLAETGCRFGEAVGLTRADVNLDQGKVHFNKSYSKRPGVGYCVGTLKTEGSDRIIRVKQSLLEELDLSGEFVFTTELGTHIKDNFFRKNHWGRALINSGLPKHRHGHPHDLRHAHATWLLDAGISLPAIQRRLGHSDIMTTLRMYGHPGTDSEDQIISALE